MSRRDERGSDDYLVSGLLILPLFREQMEEELTIEEREEVTRVTQSIWRKIYDRTPSPQDLERIIKNGKVKFARAVSKAYECNTFQKKRHHSEGATSN